jgi:hypothetical protein
MTSKKPDLLSAFTEAARPPAPAAPGRTRAARTAAARQPRPARRSEAAPSSPHGARDQGERVTLTYRTTRPNWERIKHLAISDRVSVQALFQAALSHEFERRGLPALEE